ncbi:rRNA maturation RNase YbeY [Flavobacteriaceae bacterium R38]|nr:rRNA maturation RNase YbeY [Flavobacteriaceae bacterium R38]
MINFHYETDFSLENEKLYAETISRVIISENNDEGEINFIFCDDDYLLEINQKYLDHDTYTDIISFDYSEGKILQGDIFISIERVKENAKTYQVTFEKELRRVIVHGILHYCGYKDKSEDDVALMRSKEDEKIKMFHVEQ